MYFTPPPPPSSDATVQVAASTEQGLEGTNLAETCAVLSAAPGIIMTDIIVNFELMSLPVSEFHAGQYYTPEVLLYPA